MAKRLKIAYVLGAFPVLSETFIGNEMIALLALGYEIDPIVLSAKETVGQPIDRELAAQLRRMRSIKSFETLQTILLSPIGSWRAWRFARSLTGMRPRSALWYGAKVAAICRRLDCEHVHAHFAHSATTIAIVAARMVGRSVSFTSHGYDLYGESSDIPQKLMAANFAVAVCKEMAEHANTVVILEPADKPVMGAIAGSVIDDHTFSVR